METKQATVTFSDGRRITVAATSTEQARRVAYRIEPTMSVTAVKLAA